MSTYRPSESASLLLSATLGTCQALPLAAFAHGAIFLPTGYSGGIITIYAAAESAATFKTIEDRELTGDLVMPTNEADKWNELPDRCFFARYLKFLLTSGDDVAGTYMLKG